MDDLKPADQEPTVFCSPSCSPHFRSCVDCWYSSQLFRFRNHKFGMVQWAYSCLSVCGAPPHPLPTSHSATTVSTAVSSLHCCQHYWSWRGLFLLGRIYPNNGSSRFVWNVRTLPPDYTLSHLRNSGPHSDIERLPQVFCLRNSPSVAFYIHSHCCVQIVMFQTHIIRPYLEPIKYIPRLLRPTSWRRFFFNIIISYVLKTRGKFTF